MSKKFIIVDPESKRTNAHRVVHSRFEDELISPVKYRKKNLILRKKCIF